MHARKRGPIVREVRRYLTTNPAYGGLVVMCMGIRATESSGRAKLQTLNRNAANNVAGREWYDWHPIHNLTTPEVFGMIARAGEKPHWAYAKGMSRLSCYFCIMASEVDLRSCVSLNFLAQSSPLGPPVGPTVPQTLPACTIWFQANMMALRPCPHTRQS
jgi:DNA sulfur modification protein DndC